VGRGKKHWRRSAATLAINAVTRSNGGDELVVDIGDLADAACDARGVGEVLRLEDGQELVVDAETPALIARGLAQITSIRRREDGLYFVRYADGSTALLDIDGPRIAFSNGPASPTDPRILGAMAVAALGLPGTRGRPSSGSCTSASSPEIAIPT
jgi:hypothetical protein